MKDIRNYQKYTVSINMILHFFQKKFFFLHVLNSEITNLQNDVYGKSEWVKINHNLSLYQCLLIDIELDNNCFGTFNLFRSFQNVENNNLYNFSLCYCISFLFSLPEKESFRYV